MPSKGFKWPINKAVAVNVVACVLCTVTGR